MNLAQQQQAWLATLFGGAQNVKNAQKTDNNDIKNGVNSATAILTNGHNLRGFEAYRSNGLEMAHRTLAGAYPVVQQLMGEDSFAALASALWQAHPPYRGDLAQWGADLPGFARHSAQLADEPYLADVARAEWTLHGLATVADEVTDTARLQLLITHDPSVVKLCISQSGAWFSSPWPVASIWLAHQAGHEDAAGALAQAGAMIRQQVAQTVVTWRDGLRPRLREAVTGEAPFLAALSQGLPLEGALQLAPALDFAAWLPMAVQSGLLLGAGVDSI